MAVFWTY